MILEVQGIHSYYGTSHVLHGVSLAVGKREVVALLGRNGAGKTTTLKGIVGLVPPRRGSVRFKGEEITGRPAHYGSRRGIGYVPEERGVFSYLTVVENLTLGYRPSSRWNLDDAFRWFPKLRELAGRYGRQLSGGEQQMVAIARALLTGPEILLLDEPSQGLAPVIVDSVFETIKGLAGEGLSILLVEQNVELSLEVADRVYLLEERRIVFGGTAAELRSSPERIRRHLGVEVG